MEKILYFCRVDFNNAMPVNYFKALLFRMIHYENIEYILTHGMCCKSHHLADPNYINIGHAKLINQRIEYPVGINPPGGNLGEYVPFYFGGHSPMLLNIITGYRGVERFPQEDIVFVCCQIETLVQHCQEWCFTNGHAKNTLTEFFNDLKDLDKIDWKMVDEQWWRPIDEDYDRQRRKQAEFLVKNIVPLECISTLIVKNQGRKDDIQSVVNRLNLTIPIIIDSQNKYYFR